MTLRRKATVGMVWVGVSNWVVQAIGFAASVVLARLLPVEDFGLLGLASVVLSLSSVLCEAGFGGALVQQESADQETADTAFVINLSLSLFLGAIVFVASPLIANLFDQPAMSPITRVLALNIILASSSVVPANLLEHGLEFKRKVLPTTIPSLAYAVVATLCAFAGWRVWSLVAGTVASVLLRTVLMWRVSKYRPTWQFRWEKARALWRFGQHLVYSSLLLFAAANLDKLYIGLFVDVAEVGFYGLAFTLGNLSVEYVAKLFNRVLFPAFSRAQADLRRIRAAYLAGVRHIAYIAFPMCGGLFVVAPTAIAVLYGDKWAPTVPLVRILVFYGLFRSVGKLNGALLSGIGKPALTVRLLIFRLALLALLVFPLGSRFAAAGVSLALTLSMGISVLWGVHLINTSMESSFSDFFGQVGPQAVAATLMSIGVYLLSSVLGVSVLTLCMLCFSGVVVYGLVLWLIARRTLEKDVADSASLFPAGLRRLWPFRAKRDTGATL